MDNTAAIFAMFGGQSIYDAFPTDEFPEDIQGWRSTHHVFEKTIDALHPSVIAEVGVWKGGSSIHMAKICRSLGLNTKVLSIDTFLGSVEHVMKKEHEKNLNRLHGYPRLYHQFISNVIRNELTDYIIPMPVPASEGLAILSRLGVQPDIIHVDGAHDYHNAYRDLVSSWALLPETGLLIVDDYLAWKEVTRATYKVCYDNDAILFAMHGKAIMCKSTNVLFEMRITSRPHRNWVQLA